MQWAWVRFSQCQCPSRAAAHRNGNRLCHDDMPWSECAVYCQCFRTRNLSVVPQWHGRPGATAPTWTSSTLNDGDVVHVVVSTAGGCTAQSTPIAITVQGQPTVSVSVNPASATICQGQTIVFTATASGAGPSPSFQWYVNNIAVGANSPVFSTLRSRMAMWLPCELPPPAAVRELPPSLLRS
jgi:hypothetical protein